MMDAAADLPLVKKVLAESGVEQTVPTPGLAAYLQAVAEHARDWLNAHSTAFGTFFSSIAGLGPVAATVVAGVTGALLVAVLVKLILARRRRAAPALVSAPVPASPRARPEPDREAWREELERRLTVGDVAGGLEALWWWFACSLCSTRVDRSWTSHELLKQCRRVDLTPLARQLDRLLYGADRPAVEDLRRFFHRLRTSLP